MTAPASIFAALGVWVTLGVYVSITDMRRGVIPRRAVWSAGTAIALLLGVATVAMGSPGRLLWAGVGAASVGLFFEVVYRVWPGRIGYGDVRLIIVNTFLAGWWGMEWAWWALFAGAVAECPVALVVLRRAGRSATVRWAPGLVVGTAIVVGWRLWAEGPVN